MSMIHDSDTFVVGVTATFRRPTELRRLIDSLPHAGSTMRALVVVDNAADPAVQQLAATSTFPVEYHAPGSNIGCGGGLQVGERLAFERFGNRLTHIWILDDDVVVAPGSLDVLVKAMDDEQAHAVHPLVVDGDGRLGWFPGLLDRNKFRVIHLQQTPEQFIDRCGSSPVPFSWAQGIALLVRRPAFDQLGFHRADYWVRGEDLEFSLRLTYQFRGLYVPQARVQHLPPASPSASSLEGEYRKHCAMLQNIAYTSLRLPHGRRIARTVPGNWLRFVRMWGWQPRVVADVFCAFWRGAIRGWPAGHNQTASA